MTTKTATAEKEVNAGIPAEAQELVGQAEAQLQRYTTFKIAKNEDYVLGADELKKIKEIGKNIESKRKAMTAPLDEAKKQIMDFFRTASDFCLKAEGVLKNEMLRWQTEQERIRAEQEAKVQEAARKEEERKRKVLEAQALKAEAKGNAEKAAELRQQKEEVFVEAPVVVSSVPVVAGIKSQTRWTFRVVNAALIPRQYMQPNVESLRALATATKGTLQIPGVEFYAESGIAASTR